MKIYPLAAVAALGVRLRVGFIVLLAFGTANCSTYMEATRPDPVDLDKFRPGEARINVIAEVGTPTSSVKDQDKSCDVYQLYTHGPGAWGKAGIAFGEAAADFFTLGLAEVATTPAEAATRNKLHTVLFCYGAEDKLVAVHESDSSDSTAANPQSTPSAALASAPPAATYTAAPATPAAK